MRPLDDAAVERIWKHNVLPYIEEHLFGERDKLREFALERLRGAGVPGATERPAADGAEQGDSPAVQAAGGESDAGD